jgi:transposase
VAILNIIRRWHFRDHVSLREIAKRLGISRNTVRRYIRAGATLPAYPERHSPSKLDGFAAKRRVAEDRGGPAAQAAQNPQTASLGPVCAGFHRVL